jgi:hypothetical protein
VEPGCRGGQGSPGAVARSEEEEEEEEEEGVNAETSELK